MPLVPRLTNPGRTLTNHYFGGESDSIREIPPEFRAALDLTVLEIPLPWDQEIVPLSDTVLASRATQNETSERIRRTTLKPPGPVQLVEFATNKDKQFVTRTRNFKYITDAIGSPGPSLDIQTKNLGNLHVIEELEDAQFVFTNLTSTTEKLDVLPEKWRALIPIIERKETFTGLVTDPPVLGPNEFSRRETQEDVFNMSRATRSYAQPGPYPIDLFEEKMTAEQQVETCRERLSDVTQHLTPTSTMVEGEVSALGDGRTIMRTCTVDSVFPKLMTSQERVDRTPEVFRAAIPLDEKRSTFAGTVLDPQVLGTNELFRQETQDTVFNMTRTTRKRTPLTGYPIHVFESKLTPEQQVETIDNCLDLGLQTITPSSTMLEGNVTNLGDGRSVMTTGTVGSIFPRLTTSQERVDRTPEVFRAAVPLDEKKVTFAGTVLDPQVLGTDELFRQETQETIFNITRTTRKRTPLSGYPIHVLESKLTRELQIETVDNCLNVGLQTLSPTATTVEGEVTNLGDGRSVMRTGTTPVVFEHKTTTKEIIDVIPTVFKATLPIFETKLTFTGTVTDPQILGPGELSRSETQDDVFNITRTIRSRSPGTYPVYAYEYKLAPDKQIETITNKLDLGLQTLVPSATMLEGDVMDLGNGSSVMVTGTVPTVFSHLMTSQERVDRTPEVFRASIPLDERRSTFTGTVVDPQVLGTDELFRSETQDDVFNLTRTTRKRTPLSGYPVHVLESKLTPEQLIETVDNCLDVGLQTITPTSTMLDGTVTNLGDGRSVRTTGTIPSVFPRLMTSQERTDVTPEVFRAGVPLNERRSTFPGTVLDPQVLGVDELFRSETQDTAFNITRTTRQRTPLSGYPFHIFESRLAADKQIETIDNCLDNGLQTITATATMVEGVVKNLGDGRSVRTTGTVPTVFPKLTTSIEVLDVVPEVFKATIPIYEKRITFSGTVTDPQVLGTGELSRSETQEDVFNITRTTRQRGSGTYPAFAYEYKLTQDKQVETITNRLDTGLQTITPTGLMLEADVRDLGNGTSVLRTGTVGTLFTRPTYSIEIPITIPERFRPFAPITTTTIDSAGVASPPTLTGTQFERTVEQIDVFNIRTRTKDLSSITLPVNSTSYRYNKRLGRIETILDTLAAGLQTLAPTALTTEASVQDLGNGLSLKSVATVSSLFARKVSGVEIADLIPIEFRGVVKTFTTEEDVSGPINDPPTLVLGDLERVETQLDDYTKRVRIKNRGSISLPQSLVGGKKIVEKFGVQLVADQTITLAATGTQVIPTGPLVIDAEIRQIGSGMEIATKSLVSGTAWPILHSTLYDPEMRVLYTEDKQVVDPATAPVVLPPTATFTEEYKALDQWHTLRIRTTKIPKANSPATANVSDVMRPYTFPGRFDYNVARVFGGVAAHKVPKSSLVRVTQRQWWTISATKPVIAYDEIISQDALWWDQATQSKPDLYANVLCDTYSIYLYTGIFVVTASKPSLSEYLGLGPPVGAVPITITSHQGFDYITGSNTHFFTDFVVGQWYGWPGGGVGKVVSITSNTNLYLQDPYASAVPSDPVGTAYTSTVGYTGGTTGTTAGWIGTPRIIAASVEPDRQPNLWKITTQEVIMR